MLLRAARSEHIRRRLQEAYAVKLPPNKLRVFCVSSKMYDKGIEQDNPELIDGSEIPMLRRFCRSISAEAKLADARSFLGPQLSSLLSSATLWACDTACAIEQSSVHEDAIYQEFAKVESRVRPATENN